VGTVGQLVVPGGNGYVYPRGDVDALTQCLRKVLNAPDRWEEMGRVSLKIARRNSYEQFIDILLAALDYVTQGK
jgi:glycosyltransferase involved in cell wall biosynthesis